MIGQTISHYKILEKLGGGGMGVVYKAEDTKLKRFVALKFLPSSIMASEAEKTRFIHEAQAAAALDHPNICTIHEIDEADGQLFIAMAYIEGQSLKEKIESGPLKLGEALGIAMQVSEGLQAAHEKGITHRDIKPANIMVTPKGQAKIMDFGLAKLAGQSRLTKTGMTMGTVAYMSPEQLQGIDVDHCSDIWSFGVVLYEMITGRLPFAAEYEAALAYSIMNETPKPLARYKADVSEGLQRVVDKALDKDRETRYQHMDDLLADLKRERKSTAEFVKPTNKKVKRSKPRPTKIIFAAFAIVSAMLMIISIYLLNKPPAKHIFPIHKQITFVGNAYDPAISPDGQYVAYVTDQPKGGHQVMIQDLTGGQPLEIFNAEFCLRPRWSPDGTKLTFKAPI
ncbi:MAG: serine/threonine-protein kinase, partial [Anaerolineae bacterium]|nr:serine/threonine-protein kinase [Anaerolineae bacterium]